MIIGVALGISISGRWRQVSSLSFESGDCTVGFRADLFICQSKNTTTKYHSTSLASAAGTIKSGPPLISTAFNQVKNLVNATFAPNFKKRANAWILSHFHFHPVFDSSFSSD